MLLTNYLLNKADHARFRILMAGFDKVGTLMDIGCGSNPQTYIKADYLFGADPQAGPMNDYHEYTIFKCDWQDALEVIEKGFHVDCVTLFDVVEHLGKDDAMRLLKKTTELVKQVVVFTPYGFLEQGDGQWNTHRSGWAPDDFWCGWQTETFNHYHWCDFKGRRYPEPKPALLAAYGVMF